MYGKEVPKGRTSGRDHRREVEGRKNIPGNRSKSGAEPGGSAGSNAPASCEEAKAGSELHRSTERTAAQGQPERGSKAQQSVFCSVLIERCTKMYILTMKMLHLAERRRQLLSPSNCQTIV